jgi:hypothetical protein
VRDNRRPKILEHAQKVWARSPITGLSVPHWYAGLYGVPSWHLRQPCRHNKKMDDKRKGLALLVRMNFILDFLPHLSREERSRVDEFSRPRVLRMLLARAGPIYDGSDYRMVSGSRMNTSYALSMIYNWQRALACTVGNFVHLLSILCL